MAQQTAPESATESLQNTIAGLVNDLLDAHYDTYPSSNAFGAEYDAPGTDADGTYYVGREHAADGADNSVGFDYLYRRFPDPDEPRRREATEYVFGKYGWMDAQALVDEASLLRSLFEEAAGAGYLTESDLERFDAAVETAANDLRLTREQYDLTDLADRFRSHDIDTLRTLLAHGDEEGRVVWQLLFSKDEDGDHIENPIEVPVLSESDQFMLVTTERYYWDEDAREGKHYDYAAVVGYDDTPQRFFVHRLDGRQLGTHNAWTPARVKDAMGFDYNLAEVDTQDMPYGTRVRVQGDLTVVRHHYDAALSDYKQAVAETELRSIRRQYAEQYRNDNPAVEEQDGVYVSRSGRVAVRTRETAVLKEIQEAVGIEEETVRAEQEALGYQRLTAKRRAEIVAGLIESAIVEWASEHEDVMLAAIKREAREEARETFEDTVEQANGVLGNHTLLLGGVTEHPDLRFGDEGAQGAYVVPDHAEGLLIHDEHEDKVLELGPGVYEFRFLDGHEDEWWQNQT